MVIDATRTALLDAAQDFAQERGYNAFSFRDLAGRVGVRTASIHYHFPTKGDLGRALMERYRLGFMEKLDAIDRGAGDARRKLDRFVALFRKAFRDGGRMCLCGMLASEYATLPRGVQVEVERFFVASEMWLSRVLEEGRRRGRLAFEGSAETAARTLFSALEGAMMAARAFGDEGRLVKAGRWLVEQVAR